jgi:hypothetical protein
LQFLWTFEVGGLELLELLEVARVAGALIEGERQSEILSR